MALNRPLNDDEVYSEMKKMTAFIRQEAFEKAREIKAKADEEFNIEKAKIVRQDSVNVEKAFERKVKQAEFNKRITTSNLINKCRLQLLQKRQEMLNNLFEEAFNNFENIRANSDEYKRLLKEISIQALIQLSEENAIIYVLKSDIQTMESILSLISSEYTTTTGKSIKLTLDQRSFLSEDCGGGVVVSSPGNKIQVDNTLRSRLNICSEEMLPQIRVALFGHSQNRKFFD
ncbi:hypothetical protein BB559_003246 [Furculomyces boomerangus]|uniref:V-type proton ATPase subunit E n=2 Tax=Harpellales TaxID=61421 RepID=A0A2T9YMJ4_9FUNG|nr:hypothetical protein BB559_003246 [Furculomyces boomerangus]PVZ96845.1 hypothetical protein BB558_007226 [Smittium angustum]PVZ99776.1 hypothetical protein BB558_004169 [Smittium angustum]